MRVGGGAAMDLIRAIRSIFLWGGYSLCTGLPLPLPLAPSPTLPTPPHPKHLQCTSPHPTPAPHGADCDPGPHRRIHP